MFGNVNKDSEDFLKSCDDAFFNVSQKHKKYYRHYSRLHKATLAVMEPLQNNYFFCVILAVSWIV